MPTSFNHFKGWLCYYPHCEDGWAGLWEANSCQSHSATWQQSQVYLQPHAVYNGAETPEGLSPIHFLLLP